MLYCTSNWLYQQSNISRTIDEKWVRYHNRWKSLGIRERESTGCTGELENLRHDDINLVLKINMKSLLTKQNDAESLEKFSGHVPDNQI